MITLTAEQLAEYRRIGDRLTRATAELRRAQARNDQERAARAERSLATAVRLRDDFCRPFCEGLASPEHIRATFEAAWSGPSGAGVHVHVVDMRRAHVDISGPEYHAVREVAESGAPPLPCVLRRAPTVMRVAWFALGDMIARGKILVLDPDGAPLARFAVYVCNTRPDWPATIRHTFHTRAEAEAFAFAVADRMAPKVRGRPPMQWVLVYSLMVDDKRRADAGCMGEVCFLAIDPRRYWVRRTEIPPQYHR